MLAATSYFERKRAIAVTLYQPLNLLMPHVHLKDQVAQMNKVRSRTMRNANGLLRHILL